MDMALVQCPHCGTMVGKGKFCNHCGLDMAQEPSRPTPSVPMECTRCGLVIETARHTCLSCNGRLMPVVAQPSSVARSLQMHPAGFALVVLVVVIATVAVMKAYPQLSRLSGYSPNTPEVQPNASNSARDQVAEGKYFPPAGDPRYTQREGVTPTTAKEPPRAERDYSPPPRTNTSSGLANERSYTDLPAGEPQEGEEDPIAIGPDGLPIDSVVASYIGALTSELSENKLRQFSNEKLCLLRNEYFVRHGYTFSEKSHEHLTGYFRNQPWYATRPVQGYDNDHTIPWGNFSTNEQKTIIAIQGIERSRGSWHITHQGAPR